jgi:hypothetical protein
MLAALCEPCTGQAALKKCSCAFQMLKQPRCFPYVKGLLLSGVVCMVCSSSVVLSGGWRV